MTQLSLLSKVSPVQIHLKEANRDLISCEPHIREFFEAFLSQFGFIPYGDLHVVHHGIDEKSLGFSAFQLTQAFSLSMHCVDETADVYIQFFTQHPRNLEQLACFATDFFDAKRFEINVHT